MIVEKIRLPFAQHDVARLKIAIQEEVALGTQKKFREALEIVFQRLLVKWDSGETQKIVFEIVEVPDDGLAIEAATGITNAVVEIAASLDLKFRKRFNGFAVGFCDIGRNCGARSMFGEKFEESGVAEVLFDVSSGFEIVGINFRDREAVTEKVAGEFEERRVLFPDVVEDTNRFVARTCQADDLTARTAKFSLKGGDARGRFVNVQVEETL